MPAGRWGQRARLDLRASWCPFTYGEARLQSEAHGPEDKVELGRRLDSDGLTRPVAFEKEQLVAITDNRFHGIPLVMG